MLPQSLVDLLPHPHPLSTTAGVDAGGTLPTGVEALDAGLAGGGLPRGRLTEVIGARGSGKATLLRQIVGETLRHAGWVAYIDATRTLAPRDWAPLGEGEGLWMIRPRDASRAVWCADVLLRCGAFALVVIDSAPLVARGVAVRLTRLARESGAALIIAGDEGGGSLVGGAVRLLVRRETGGRRRGGGSIATSHPPPAASRERRMTIRVEKGGGGTHRTVEVSCAIGVARRLCTHSEVPDRRGVARREAGRPGSDRRAAPVALPSHGAAAPPNDSTGGVRVLARKRRCAEPEFAAGDLHSAADVRSLAECSVSTGTLG
jgi:recombination protein RecA